MAARTALLIVRPAVLIVCLAGAASSSGLAAGHPVMQAELPAARIISVVPAAPEILFAIGAGSRLVAVSSYDELPPGAGPLPRVGALLNPDTERILSLRPDLVIVYGSQVELQARLERAGIRTYSYRHAGIEGVLDTIRQLGTLSGRPMEGARLAADMRARLDAVAARVRGRTAPRTLLLIDREPGSLRGMYVSGGRGFLHELLALAGGANIFGDTDREAVQPSIETLLGRRPEVIVELRAAGMIDARQAPAGDVWQSLTAIPAVRSGRVYVLDGVHLVVPGSRLADGAEALARLLHPDAFR